MSTRFISFAAALVTVVLLTPFFRTLALRLEVIDRPDSRKLHLSPTPLLGGMAIYLAVVSGLLLAADGDSWRQMAALLLGATFILLVGLMDDHRSLHPRVKLMAAIPFSGLILAAGGIRITAFPGSRWWSAHPEALFYLSLLLTVLWVLVITSAFTILDHMDGLCAGIAAIASVFFFLWALVEGLYLVGVLSAAMLGANLGFLKWNFSPATIFMGDCGALFIGFMISAMAILVKFPDLTVYTSWMIPLLILWVPLFDTTLVLVSRFRRGLAPSRSPGKDHAAHRLTTLGLTHSGAVILLYGVAISLGALSFLLRSLSIWQSYLMAGLVLALVIVGIAWLERAPYEHQQGPLMGRRKRKTPA